MISPLDFNRLQRYRPVVFAFGTRSFLVLRLLFCNGSQVMLCSLNIELWASGFSEDFVARLQPGWLEGSKMSADLCEVVYFL